MSETYQQSRLHPFEKIAYGLGDTASNIVFQTVMLLLAFFYTDVFGLSAAAMGTLFLAIRILDAITDPIMGAICDRTITRWGKFRPYLLWMSVPFAVICVITFTTPDFGPAGKLIYAFITYGLLMLVYTAINIPYCALGGVITTDSRERVSLNSYRFFLATGGGLIVASLTLPLVKLLGKGNDQKGYQLAMVILGSAAIVMFLICFFFTRERVLSVSSETITFRNDFKILLSNDQWWVVAGLNLILLIPIVIRNSAAVYYIKWYAARSDLITSFLTVGMAAGMVGAASASTVTKYLSKVTSYVIIQTIIVILSVLIFFVTADQIFLMYFLFSSVQFFVQMGAPILWAMMADTVDYGEYKTGRRITGLIFSGVLFSLKLGVALGGALFGWLLAYFGYQNISASQITQPYSAIKGIVFLFSILPAAWHVLLIGLVCKYKLNDKYCDQICINLRQRRLAGTSI